MDKARLCKGSPPFLSEAPTHSYQISKSTPSLYPIIPHHMPIGLVKFACVLYPSGVAEAGPNQSFISQIFNYYISVVYKCLSVY